MAFGVTTANLIQLLSIAADIGICGLCLSSRSAAAVNETPSGLVSTE